MTGRRPTRPVATLWQLAWNGNRICCAVYRSGGNLEMRLESGRTTLFAEPFELGPRMLWRTDALKRSLQRRGWRED